MCWISIFSSLTWCNLFNVCTGFLKLGTRSIFKGRSSGLYTATEASETVVQCWHAWHFHWATVTSQPASQLSENKWEIQVLGYLNCFCANQKTLSRRRKKVSHATLLPLLETRSSNEVIKRATLPPELPIQSSRPEVNIQLSYTFPRPFALA